jgi:uncharacterized membrane protein
MFFKNKRIFEICNNDIEEYNDLMKTLLNHYNECITNININININDIRTNVHKLISIISIFDNNYEINYICKTILSIDKNYKYIDLYLPYIEMLNNFQKYNLFFV